MAYIISDNLKRNRHDARLRKEAYTADFYAEFAGTRDIDTPASIPDGICIKVPNPDGSTTHTIPLLRELTQGVVVGRQKVVGTEEDLVTASLKVYANSWAKAVGMETYGVDYAEGAYLKLMQEVTPAIGRAMGKQRGQYMREAICEIFSSNLTEAPVSVTQGINPNLCFIDGTATTDTVLPATYHPTLSTYQTNIQAVATAIGTPDQYNRLSVGALNAIMDYAIQTKSIRPLVISGKERYILSMSPRQKRNLMDPKGGDSNLFSLFKEADFRGKNRALKYEMWEYGSLLLVVDERHPVCTVTGGTVSFTYKGITDGRDLTAGNTKFDVCILHGNEVLYQYEKEPMHWKENLENYGKDKGIGGFCDDGYILAHYDAPTPTASSMVQQGSVLFLATSN